MTIKTLEPKERQFKNTEIGAIPHEWDLVSFDEAFDFLRTASYSREQLGSVGDVQYIHYGDVHTKWNYYVDLSKVRIPTVDSSMAGRYTRIRTGDLVVVDASEDYVGLSKSVEVTGLSEKEAISGLHTFLLRDKGSNFVDGYRGYITSSPLVKPSLDRYATGMKVFGVSKTNLKLVLIPKPPKAEQESIVKALRDTEDLIESLEKLIGKKRAIKQGVMQELLTGKRRLPGFAKGWHWIRVGDVFRVTRGQVLSMEKVSPNKVGDYRYPVYSSQTKEDGLAGYYTDYLFYDCITWTTDGANAGEVKYRVGKFYCTNVCGVLENKDGYANLCLASMLNRVSRKYVSYVGNPKLMNNIAADIRLFVPKDLEEQKAIASILEDHENEILSLDGLVSKYRNIKQGMMHGLLSGKIRLTA